MNTGEHRLELDLITRKVIGCAYRVGNALGCGFLEKVYENALVIELHRAGLFFERQRLVVARCDNIPVGDFTIDLLVENEVVVELKAAKAFDEVPYCPMHELPEGGRSQSVLADQFWQATRRG